MCVCVENGLSLTNFNSRKLGVIRAINSSAWCIPVVAVKICVLWLSDSSVDDVGIRNLRSSCRKRARTRRQTDRQGKGDRERERHAEDKIYESDGPNETQTVSKLTTTRYGCAWPGHGIRRTVSDGSSRITVSETVHQPRIRGQEIASMKIHRGAKHEQPQVPLTNTNQYGV